MQRPLPGFTLIELLVVISIIALLLALLIPALGSARLSAHKTLSLANLKGMGFGVHMYAADNLNVLPAGSVDGYGAHFNAFLVDEAFGALCPPELFRDPALKNQGGRPITLPQNPGSYWSPGDEDGDSDNLLYNGAAAPDHRTFISHYRWNSLAAGGTGGADTWHDSHTHYGFREAEPIEHYTWYATGVAPDGPNGLPAFRGLRGHRVQNTTAIMIFAAAKTGKFQDVQVEDSNLYMPDYAAPLGAYDGPIGSWANADVNGHSSVTDHYFGAFPALSYDGSARTHRFGKTTRDDWTAWRE